MGLADQLADVRADVLHATDRRTYGDLTLPGAIMDRAQTWLEGTSAKPFMGKGYKFPTGPADNPWETFSRLTFGYIMYPRDVGQYKSAEQRAAIYEKQILPKARDVFRVNQNLFEQGQTDFLRLLQAQRTLIEADLGYIDAQEARWSAAATIAGESAVIGASLKTGVAHPASSTNAASAIEVERKEK
jgi:hypothetical protein